VSVQNEITKPNVSNVFLLEVTAGLLLAGFVLNNPTVTAEDWGDLTAATSTADWGDLTAVNEPSEDWESINYSNTYRVTSSLNVTAVKSFRVGSTTTLTQRTNTFDVENNAGSWYSDGTYVYVRPAAGQSIYTWTYRATVQFYFSSKPKNFNGAHYDPRLTQVPNLSLRIEPRFSGVGQIGSGTATLINSDGYFDALDSLQWDAGTATFRMGVDTNAATMAYSEYIKIGTWNVEATDKDEEDFKLKLREPKTGMDKQLPLTVYDQTTYPNIKPEDVGRPIPRAYGKILGAKPVLIDATLKKFKVAGHAIHSFDAVRIQIDNGWEQVPFASTDATNGEFTLGNAWANNEPVSVDFWGMKNSDGTVMVNCADIVEDLLTYAGETSIEPTTFDRSYTLLDIGSQHDIFRATSFKPSIYMDRLQSGLQVLGLINRLASSFAFIDFEGRWHYRVFEGAAYNLPKQDWGNLDAYVTAEDWGDLTAATEFEDWNTSTIPSFTENDIVEGSYAKEVETSDVYSKVVVKYGERRQDGWRQMLTVERDTTQFLHDEQTAVVKEVEAEFWDTHDAQYYAERLLMTEGQPLVRHKVQIPWQAFLILPGDNVHLNLTREGLNAVLEVLEVKHDLVGGKVALTLGDRRAFGDSIGHWVDGNVSAWSGSATAATKASNRQSNGYWHGTDLMASATDEASWQISKWW